MLQLPNGARNFASGAQPDESSRGDRQVARSGKMHESADGNQKRSSHSPGKTQGNISTDEGRGAGDLPVAPTDVE
jgi:hypothetical protein